MPRGPRQQKPAVASPHFCFRICRGDWPRNLEAAGDLFADGALGGVGGAAVLHYDPLVLYMPGAPRRTLGMPGTGVAMLKQTPTVFLIAMYGSIESHANVRRHRHAAILHRWRWPNHKFVFLCNTARENALLREAGEVAGFLNHNVSCP